MNKKLADVYNQGFNASCRNFKIADVQFVMPSIAGAILGGTGGTYLGSKLLPEKYRGIGSLAGTIVGSSVGKSLGDTIEQKKKQENEFQLDPTAKDIPPWAIEAAKIVRQPYSKVATTEGGIKNMLATEALGPAASFIEGAQKGGLGGSLRLGLGTTAGGVAGGAAGLLLAKAIQHGLGLSSDPRILGVHMTPLLMGLGSTVAGNRAYEALSNRR